jgi:prepilin-type N-terminal cleavage/methylation domain-containing protein
MRPRASQTGFTAIEMMVVVLILAILAAFAAPAMNDLIRSQKTRSAAYDIFADLTYARSEAISRGHDVQMASAAGKNWASGWGIRDIVTGQILRMQGKLSDGLDFTADATTLTFDRNGRTTTVTFSIQPKETAPDNQKRCVRISPSGRPNSLTGPCP